MKKVFLRLAKYTALFLLFVLLSAFVWANWSEPTAGERAAVVNFIPYDVSDIHDSTAVKAIGQRVKSIPGVRVMAYNGDSKLLSIGYAIDDTDQETIEQTVYNDFRVKLHEKVFKQSGPKCPVGGSLTLIARIKGFFCLRD